MVEPCWMFRDCDKPCPHSHSYMVHPFTNQTQFTARPRLFFAWYRIQPESIRCILSAPRCISYH
ncbi:hypothetical protein SERLADRAFT_456607 [Serpula lacrymans var. lacrymans S7.9]|uniref:Uncharacterized protein n=1 Tax=Serpula lacrymans var. lacrymans (strain S7.9) TaxID=578457 RepID=F8NHM0_SERL9|nr:uncharacterized protein SERLADRAFT_456607 [Serpula lacrymans var. lacrymans S7.9]EGO29191.1 hypothetical protein SERLADRAFT_456607 [Serpula lacrymans var. lacrymans S7.9]